MKLLPVVAACVLVFGAGRVYSQSSKSVPVSYLQGGTALQTYRSPELGLSLQYPASLNREDAAHVSGFDRAVFALHPAADPAHIGADPCAPLVLTLGSGLDLPAKTETKGKGKTLTPKGTLTLTEVKRGCLEKDATDDTVLAGLVGQTEKLEGMRPLTKMTSNLVQGTTVWSATGARFGKDAKGRRVASAGVSMLGSVGAVVNGHVLLWTISANDAALFERLLGFSACFDAPSCSSGFSQIAGPDVVQQPNPAETATR